MQSFQGDAAALHLEVHPLSPTRAEHVRPPRFAAGLWEVTVTPDGPLESVTVVNRDPVPGLEVHDRMPALLLSQDLDAWLRGTPQEALEAAMISWPSGLLVHTTA
ncbi:SOS response-associated peptidase [Deinococcus aetherius]|uniref:SOS response-associated peptidase n=1 Tax=Deinococcus aetherius TaxID=200252 RepID=UPI00222EEA72|nr:SOS response-associated peptidase [Deinococcus aetherius]